MNFYNEIDPFAAAWLRELIKADLIAPGVVDERSIEDIKPNELTEYTQCHFFAGIGVWSYALRQAGWPDDRPVWTGSCPCQPFSAAGKRAGTSDERHLWPALFHLLENCRPDALFSEQVASKDGLSWLDLVSSDLEAAGYAIGAADLCAAGVGAPHIRQRLYLVADSNSKRLSELQRQQTEVPSPRRPKSHTETWWAIEPAVCRLADGVTNQVGKLRGYGNAIVAPVAQAFIEAYLETETQCSS